MKETVCTDSIECPYCGHKFDGKDATNYDSSCGSVSCPACEKYITIFQSVTFTAFQEE